MIIGIKEKDKVVLAYSAFDVYASITVRDMVSEENVGLWNVKRNPHTIMGCACPSTESDAYRYENEMFHGIIDYNSLTRKIVPTMDEFAKNKEYIGDEKGRFEDLLIAQDNRLFCVTWEHLVLEKDSFAVVGGYGVDFAKSILYATDGESSIDRIKKAFEFTAQQRQSDCYPIAVMDTATKKLRIINRPHQTKVA